MHRTLATLVTLALGLTASATTLTSPQSSGTGRESRRMAILAAEENRAATADDLRVLIESAQSGSEDLRVSAIRALGRLERRDVIPHLLPLLRAPERTVREEAANALAQSFRGEPLPDSSSAEQVQVVLDALSAAPKEDAVYRSIGRLPYETVDQVRAAEAVLRPGLDLGNPPAAAARGAESLARLRSRLSPLSEDAVERLRQLASRRSEHTVPPEVRRNAMAAVFAAQAADAVTLRAALLDEAFEVRRLAILAAGGAGPILTADERLEFIQTALQDRSPAVRVEAVRAWARRAATEHGCAPLVTALSDSSLHVVLAALDVLGDQCKEDELLTTRLTSEARTPPGVGRWQREAHAFVALAKRSPERAAIGMAFFARHDNPYVRVYAARAAAAMNDIDTLRRLAADPDDNVVEAALPPIRRRLGADSDDVFIAALDRRSRTTGRIMPARPYQVIREAAMQLKGAESNAALVTALGTALQRFTEDRCQTSRDARLALIDRLAELGSTAQATLFMPLLRDVDPRIAESAASLLNRWTGRPYVAEPLARQPELPPARSLDENVNVKVEMETGKAFWVGFYSREAPLARDRFLRLVRARYYDGTPFHRMVPNFVIQGGSPNANEFCGDCPFMRDEVGLIENVRGTIGVSTRGRDTGDAQIFVNLVDNARLDHDYTVFAYVCADDLDVIDDIQEGDRMRRLEIGAREGCRTPAR
jgi:cyclophilin family peptidyl-prolyl cis-trans isomerase/HEAT repeat protein